MIRLVEHFIQRDILRTLSRKDELTFSELKPQGIDNGVFSYHLKSLVTMNLVVRRHEKYTLSLEGAKYVGLVTRTNLDLQFQPKLFCFLIIENENGEFLLHKRHARPFLGKCTFPGGVLFFGEDLESLVERQLLEKVGFKIKMQEIGIANIRLKESSEIVSHTIAYLFYGKASRTSPNILAKDKRFTPFWGDIEQLAENDLMPDVRCIIQKVKSSEHYFSINLHLDSLYDNTSDYA